MTHQLMRITTLRPWCDVESPDSRVMFRTAAGRWLLFHTTTCEAADHILARGFEDHTCRIGFQQRASTHAVYFGGVPAIPVSVDYFDERVMTAASMAWIVVEAPPDAWPHAAVNHQQDPSWPLYQVCYQAAQVNTWPRRRLPVEAVLDYRPSLVADHLEWISEAVGQGWLAPGILARVKRRIDEYAATHHPRHGR